MTDYNPAVALNYKSPPTPDIIGPMSTLAQLQYAQANAQRAQAETGLTNVNARFQQNRLASISNMQQRIQAGEDPVSASVSSGFAAIDPAGAGALATNEQTGMTIGAIKKYAATAQNGGPLNPNSLAGGGPALVGQGVTATTGELSNTTTQATLFGQAGNILTTDPSPQGRLRAAQLLYSIPQIPGEVPGSRQQIVQQILNAPDDGVAALAKSLQSGSMSPEKLADVSGQAAYNKGLAGATTETVKVSPGENVLQNPQVQAARSGLQLPPVAGFGPPGSISPTAGVSAPPSLGAATAPPPGGMPQSTAPTAASLNGMPATATPGATNVAPGSPPNIAGQVQLFGRLGQMMIADPSPQGRTQAAQFAASIPLGPGETAQSRQQLIQQFAGADPNQYVAAGQHFVQASMHPELYAGAGQPTTSAVGTAPGAPQAAIARAPIPSTTAQPPVVARPPTAVPSLFATAAQNHGLGPQDAAGLFRTAQVESGLNPNKVNPTSGAAGLMQFVPSTWQQYGEGSPFDPVAAANGGAALWAANKAVLTQALGRPPTAAELYLAHQQGATGAAKLLTNPTAPAGSLVGNSAIASNGGNPNAPASAFTNMWTARFGVPGAPGTTTTPAGGAAMTMPPGTAGAPPASPLAPGAAAVVPTSPLAAADAIPVPPIPPMQPMQQTPSVPEPIKPPQVPTAPSAAASVPAPPSAASPVVPTAPATAAVVAPTGTAADQTQSLYQRPEQLQGMSLSEKAAQEKIGSGWGDQVNDAVKASQASQVAQIKLAELAHNLADLPDKSSFLTPGPDAVERIGTARYINTIESMAGISDKSLTFDPKQIAAAESAQKITGGLGFDLSRQLGAREAAQIVQQAISLNPGVSNTPQGAKLVSAAINAGLQRQVDYRNFLAANGNKIGSDVAFNKMYPVAHYTQEALKLASIPQAKIELLEQHSNDPRAAPAFDQVYGPGMSRYYVGSSQ